MKLNKVVSAGQNIKVESDDLEEDYDFDFSIYKEEEDSVEVLDSITKDKTPNVTGLRSRYSPSLQELENLVEIKKECGQYSIKVSARSQEITTLWKFYGILEEMWSRIKPIYGSNIVNEMTQIKITCYRLLTEYRTGTIDYKLHNNLLYFKDRLYRLLQLSNLGFEVERSARAQRARKAIVE